MCERSGHTLVVDEKLSLLTEHLGTDDVHLNDVGDRWVNKLGPSVAATDRKRPMRRRLLDDGVPETVLGRHITCHVLYIIIIFDPQYIYNYGADSF